MKANLHNRKMDVLIYFYPKVLDEYLMKNTYRIFEVDWCLIS